MIGAGPKVVFVSTPTTRARYFGAELALDFMFWPSGSARVASGPLDNE